MMKVNDKSIIQICIDEFEQKTQIELKLVIEPRANSYKDKIFLILLVSVFLFWGVLHFLEEDFSFIAIYLESITVAVLLYLSLDKFMTIRYFLKSAEKIKNVNERALFHFAKHNMYKTSQRSGLLMYYSRLERTGVFIADSGVQDKIPAEDLTKFQNQFIVALNHPQFVSELGSFIRSFAVYCHTKWPDHTQENEISNEIR